MYDAVEMHETKSVTSLEIAPDVALGSVLKNLTTLKEVMLKDQPIAAGEFQTLNDSIGQLTIEGVPIADLKDEIERNHPIWEAMEDFSKNYGRVLNRESIQALTMLPERYARILAEYTKEHHFDDIKTWNFKSLRWLSSGTAKALADAHGVRLNFNNIHHVSPETAQALSQTGRQVELNGLSELSPEIARALLTTRYGSEIDLHGITSITVEAAEAFGRRGASSHDKFSLHGLQSFESGALEELAKNHGKYYFEQLEPTPEVIRAFKGKWKLADRSINFSNLDFELSPAAAKELISFDNPGVFDLICVKVSPEAIPILASAPWEKVQKYGFSVDVDRRICAYKEKSEKAAVGKS